MDFVRYVGRKSCSDTAYLAGIDNERVVLDPLPRGGNITLKFELDGSPVQVNFQGVARDLLDLSASVYIADEIVPRSESVDRWTREFDFLVPVADPIPWVRASPILTECLRILSGDIYAFTWCQRRRLSGLGNHRTKLLRKFDAVCLFSGGLDSLLGAYQLLASGKRVLLVGHQADGITASAQTELAAALRIFFPNQLALLQSRVARSQGVTKRFDLPEKMEDSHRPRSFQFLGLAVAVASAIGVKEVFIPENGLIALNPPLQSSRLGSLSTRTVHPKFLTLYSHFLAETGAYSGTIKNPFLYLSKTDMLLAMDPKLCNLALRSVSCAHAGAVRWRGKPSLRHCGYCVPCLYRRIAMMGANLDDPSDYAIDVFTELPSQTNKTQSDFRALSAFARRVSASSPAQRDMLTQSHGSFSPDVGGLIGPNPSADYAPWSDMLLRWAQDFLKKVHRLATPQTKGILGLPPVQVKVRRP